MKSSERDILAGRGGGGARRLVAGGVVALVAFGTLHLELNGGGLVKALRGGRHPGEARASLTVGFLPVTCHLTCPVTHWVTSHTDGGTVFRSKKYSEFATIAEELKSGQLHASFILAPLAMALRRQGVPIKIVHLGHRDGTTVMVAKDGPVRAIPDLRGRKLAIPHMYSNQRLLMARELAKHQMTLDDLDVVVYPPPEMAPALQRGVIDAYVVGEPMAAKAELDGYGRVLAFAKDMWPDFISCVLAVSEDLIRSDRALVQELVSGIARSGAWLDGPGEDLAAGVARAAEGASEARDGVALLPDGWDSTHRSQAAVIASRGEYYGQDPELVRFVLTKPPDRVRYTSLAPARRDLEEVQRYAEALEYFAASTTENPFGYDDYCDPTFAVGQAR